MKYLKIISYLVIFLVCSFQDASAQNSCITCHKELDDQLKAPTVEMLTDIHYKNDVTCVNCHGGDTDIMFKDDMEAAMDAKKGYIGVPDKKDIPELCARCHSNAQLMRNFNPNLPTDQFQQYLSSQHGMQLSKGDTRVAVCTDCHGIHNIQPANMTTSKVFAANIPKTCSRCHSNAEYMKEYSLPIDQYDLYQKSVHGISLLEKGDRASPACNGCHGNHGAYPPGITSISHVCGICHITQVDMFSQSPHNKAFAEMDLPQCESCHGNHEVQPTFIDMLGVGPKSLCITCHDEDSKGYRVAEEMKQAEDSLFFKIETAKTLLGKAEKAGVEVSEGKFTIKEAHNVLIKAQNAVHFFSLDKFQTIIQPGYEIANRAVHEGQLALKEVQNRRRWLAFISVIIFIVAVSLYFKIKAIKTNNVK